MYMPTLLTLLPASARAAPVSIFMLVNTTAKSRGFGLPRKAGRFAWFVGVGIAIGVAIAIAIGSELKANRDA